MRASEINKKEFHSLRVNMNCYFEPFSFHLTVCYEN